MHFNIHEHDDNKKKRGEKIGVTTEIFCSYMKQLAQQIRRFRTINIDEDCYFIMDNASIHNTDGVETALNSVSAHFHVHKLPPYSARLNIIEQVFSEWKAEARTTDSIPLMK
jgi:DNA phosphorothioation-dependent restriction protein DptG